MPKKLYNEGRVVGLDSYSLYVKQALATDGVTEVATEREWLASTIANGSSLLLQIPGGLTAGVYDIKLPSGSRLVSANTIIGSFAYGVESDSWENATTTQTISQKFKWAKRVTCYGNISKPPISKQTSAKGMSNNNNTTATTNECTSEQMQYIKIIDGIVYQFGKWKLSSVENNDKIKTVPDDIQYDQTYVRLAFRDDIASNKPFCILLTGFTDLAVVYGVTGLEGDSTNVTYNDWKNGGFLGPSKFPWASKIWFATPGNLTYELKMGLSNGGKKNVVITSDPDSPITTIEVLNNIHTSKSGGFLKIAQTLDGGDTDINIDTNALIEDVLTPGYGVNIVNSTNETSSSGSPKKVVKTNISSKNGTGIDVSQPDSGTEDQSGTKTQYISTNLGSDDGSGISYGSGTGTEKKIRVVLESGKGTGITISAGSGKAKKIVTNLNAGTGIQINNKPNQEDSDTSKTIATNLTPGVGIDIDPKSSTTSSAQTIKSTLTDGKGTKVTKGTASGTSGGSQQVDINLASGVGIKVNNSEGYIRTNIKAGTGIDIAPVSSDDNSGAQTIKNQLSGGQGINIKSITPKISTSEVTAGNSENPTVDGSIVDMSTKKYSDYYTVNYEGKRFRWDGAKWVSDGNSTAGNTNIVTTNIKAGDGISVEAINGVVQVTNTAPYVNASNFQDVFSYEVPSGEDIDVDAGIRIRYMNNWYCGCSDVSAPSGSSNNEVYNLTRIGNISTNPNDYPYVPSTNFVPFQIKMLPQWKINNNTATLSGMDVYIQSRKATKNNSGRVSTFMPMCKNLAQVTRNSGGGMTESELKSLREVNYEQYQFRIEAFWRSVVCGFDFTNARHEFKHESTGNIVKLKDIDFSGSINTVNEIINFHQRTVITLPVNNEYVLQRDGGLIIYDNSSDSYYKVTVGNPIDTAKPNIRYLTAYKTSTPDNTWTASTTNTWMTTRMYNVRALSKYLYLKDPTNENSEYWNDSIKTIIENCQFIIAITATHNITSSIDFTSDLKIYYPVLSNVGRGTYIPTTNKIAPDTPSAGVLTEGASRNRILTDIGSMVTQFNYNSTFSSTARS